MGMTIKLRRGYGEKKERNLEILRLYESGLSCAEIAKQYKVTRQTIGTIVKRELERRLLNVED